MDGIKLIIFDLDGTLVDAYKAIIESFNFAMRKAGYPKQGQAVIRRQIGWGDENLLKPSLKLKDLKKVVRIYRRHHKTALLKYSKLYPGAREVLNLLENKGYKLAIASNRPTRFSRILMRHLKIDKYFDFVLCADKLNNIKPHPEILNKIMRRFNLKPGQALYVGDMVIDAQAARRAGVKSVIVLTGSGTKPEIKKEKPSFIINKITGLSKIL